MRVSAIFPLIALHMLAVTAARAQSNDCPMPINGTLKGEATLTDAQAADLKAGKWYFNIHTAANKGGELRGQLAP